MVNVAHINKVIAAIKADNHPFNMSDYVFDRSRFMHLVDEQWSYQHLASDTHVGTAANAKNVVKFVESTPPSLCHTPACICGWANFIGLNEGTITPDPEFKSMEFIQSRFRLSDEQTAAEWLGINIPSSYRDGKLQKVIYNNLFCPPYGKKYEAVTKEQAIIVLEHLRDTGVVDWNLVDIPDDDNVSLDDLMQEDKL